MLHSPFRVIKEESKKKQMGGGKEKRLSLTAAKMSSLILKYWLLFNGLYFALYSFFGRTGYMGVGG